ncbi:MAG: 2-oxoacid:acceptor oxidoreductase subunit alpha, partial [Bacteroidales bacterium]|nr:2-oxoacid:acceptor oxidoreductase subunit alpha [Bacteroidales bacterium]
PSMKDYPAIKPPIIDSCEGNFKPFERDPKTFVRKWAIPGKAGLEHRVGGLEKNPAGTISSDPENHAYMVAQRAAKVAAVADFIPDLEVIGEKQGDLLLVGWGGTFGHLFTAAKQLQAEGRKVSLAHFDYINPLPKNAAEVFGKFGKIMVCELNSGQFADYLRARIPQYKYEQYNKVQGQPFIVEEIVDAAKAQLS